MTAPMTPEREAELREDALELDHGQLARALREALGAMAYERARADAAERRVEAAEAKYADLRWRVVHNAGREALRRKPRWSHVSDATAHGSGVSGDLCRSSEADPDEELGGSCQICDALYSEQHDSNCPLAELDAACRRA